MIAIWYLAVFLTLIGVVTLIGHYSKRSKISEGKLPPVTVLKPIFGVQNGIKENIESFFQQQYNGNFELFFCHAKYCVELLEIIKEIAGCYPHVKYRNLHNQAQDVINPKIANMLIGYTISLNDHILISDAGARVDPQYLARMVSSLKPGIGCVTGVVCGDGAKNFPGRVESVYLNMFFSRARILGYYFGVPTVMGLSMLFRKSDAKKFGGFKYLGDFLAEDYMMGQKMRELGLKICIVPEPVVQHLDKYSFENFFNRHVRWGRLRFAHAPFPFMLEPLTMSLIVSIIGGIAMHSILFFGISLGLFYLCDLISYLYTPVQGYKKSLFLLEWLFREVIALPLWIYILSSRSINWKGNKLRLHFGGKITRK